MKNVVILDLDGVLILTPPWKSDKIDVDGYSEFDKQSVTNLNILMSKIDAELWLSSNRRFGMTLEKFRQIFIYRKIEAPLIGFLPLNNLNTLRKDEVNIFLDQEHVNNFLILDDDKSLNSLPLERRLFWVATDPMIGFNSEKLNEAEALAGKWK